MSRIATLPAGKPDNQILSVVRHLQEREPARSVILVSKDINAHQGEGARPRHRGLRQGQGAGGQRSPLHGRAAPDAAFWESHGRDLESWKKDGHTYYRVRGPLVPQLQLNEFVWDESGERRIHALVKEKSGRVAVLETLRDNTHAKNSVWGITARNREQNFALNLLMNPAIDFVTLLGQAGTGKTLLLSFGEANEWHPVVMPDGRILWTRWDYINRPVIPTLGLWTILPDGTAADHYFGNYTPNPCRICQTRPIPGSHKVVATTAGHHTIHAGALILIDRTIAEDGLEAITRLTPEAKFPESEGDSPVSFGSPYPLTEDLFLAEFCPDPYPASMARYRGTTRTGSSWSTRWVGESWSMG